MLRPTTIFLTLALAQFPGGCDIGDQYEPWGPLGAPGREQLEREKRELLQIEELTIGTGPLAARGRRISADLQVRYSDGTIVFEGSIFDLVGFHGMPESGIYDNRHLNSAQRGIQHGLNGMAVGGKRRITVDRKLVCTNLSDNASPNAICDLVGPGNRGPSHEVRKETLIVEATLTESCIPVRLKAFFILWGVNWELYCRTLDEPKRDPTLPLWHFY